MSTLVVITRPDGPYAGARNLSEAVASAGCEPVLFPVLSCSRVPLSGVERELIQKALASAEQWLVFLSPTAVAVFREVLQGEFPELPALGSNVKIAVQGTGSNEMVRACFGRDADFIPSVFVAEHFAEEFAHRVGAPASGRVLVAQSAEGRNVFAQILSREGIGVATVETYATRAVVPSKDQLEALLQKISTNEAVCIVFMSPSAVHATVKALCNHREALERLRIISVGPITSRAVRKYGLSISAEAGEHSEQGVITALKAAGAGNQ